MRLLTLVAMIGLSGCGLANAFAPGDRSDNPPPGEGEGEASACLDPFIETIDELTSGTVDVFFGTVGDSSCVHEVPTEGCGRSDVFTSYEAVDLVNSDFGPITVEIIAEYDGFDGVLAGFEPGLDPVNAQAGCLTVNDDHMGVQNSRIQLTIPENEIATVTVSGIRPGVGGSFELGIDVL